MTTTGQLALVCLGVHLAGDRLDDHILLWLAPARDAATALLVPWLIAIAETAGMAPGVLVGWADVSLVPVCAAAALVVELAAIGVLAEAMLLTPRDARPTLGRWWTGRSVHSVVVPVTLAGVLLAGTWSLAMATEDLLPASPYAPIAAVLVAVAILARLAVPAWLRTVAAMSTDGPTKRGLKRSLVLVPLGALVWLEALPLRGLPQLLSGGLP